MTLPPDFRVLALLPFRETKPAQMIKKCGKGAPGIENLSIPNWAPESRLKIEITKDSSALWDRATFSLPLSLSPSGKRMVH
jgi:hypothetical protein